MINKILISAFFAFAATSVFAYTFSDIDANKDGAINKDEASVSQTITQQWEQIDTNQDGNLSVEEFAALGEIKK